MGGPVLEVPTDISSASGVAAGPRGGSVGTLIGDTAAGIEDARGAAGDDWIGVAGCEGMGGTAGVEGAEDCVEDYGGVRVDDDADLTAPIDDSAGAGVEGEDGDPDGSADGVQDAGTGAAGAVVDGTEGPAGGAGVEVTFRLRKGKAYVESDERKPRPEKKEFRNNDKPRFEGHKKPHEKKDGDRSYKPKRDRKPDKFKEREDRGPRVISAAAETQGDSPFAILQNLKVKQGG